MRVCDQGRQGRRELNLCLCNRPFPLDADEVLFPNPSEVWINLLFEMSSNFQTLRFRHPEPGAKDPKSQREPRHTGILQDQLRRCVTSRLTETYV